MDSIYTLTETTHLNKAKTRVVAETDPDVGWVLGPKGMHITMTDAIRWGLVKVEPTESQTEPPEPETSPQPPSEPEPQSELEVTNPVVPPEPEAQPEAQTEPPDLDATDRAIEVAAELGIDLTTVTGTGSNGRITVEDVRDHAQ